MTTTYATVTREPATTSLSNARLYWRISGIALAAVAALGIVFNAIPVNQGTLIPEFLAFDWTHNVVHVLLAAIALGMGFSSVDYAVAKTGAKIVGSVYLALGVLGFTPVAGVLDAMLGLHLELGENLVHIVLGGYGAYVGFAE